MHKLCVALCLATLVAAVHSATYQWNPLDERCNTTVWNGLTPSTCWAPVGIPGPNDDVYFSYFGQDQYTTIDNTTGGNFVAVNRTYGACVSVSVNTLTIENAGVLRVTGYVDLVVSARLVVQGGGELIVIGKTASVSGPGDIDVFGRLSLVYGMIGGNGSMIVEEGGTVQIAQASPTDEVYILRDTTINYGGVVAAAADSICHVGFWWEPHNVTITVREGGTLRWDGFFTKWFEGEDPYLRPLFHVGMPGNIVVEDGGTLWIANSELFALSILNYGTIYTESHENVPFVNSMTFPFGVNFTNYGNVFYPPPYSTSSTVTADGDDVAEMEFVPLGKHISVAVNPDKHVRRVSKGQKVYASSCDDLPYNSAGEIHIDVRKFTPFLQCHPFHSSGTLVFEGGGELIVASPLYLTNGIVQLRDGVSVTFIRAVQANNTHFVVGGYAELVFMYVPVGGDGEGSEFGGYPYYATRSHLYWSDKDVTVGLDAVRVSGRGSVVFVTPPYVSGSLSLAVSAAHFEREFGAGVITGGDGVIVVEESCEVVFGTEASLSKVGRVEVFGTFSVPSYYNLTLGVPVNVREGGEAVVDGVLELSGKGVLCGCGGKIGGNADDGAKCSCVSE